MPGVLNEFGVIKALALRHAADAFRSQDLLDAQSQELHYLETPDFAEAIREYDVFLRILEDAGIQLHFLPPDDDLTPDSIYVRDATMITPLGLLPTRMGKPQRMAEPEVNGSYYKAQGFEVLPSLEGRASLEGGDVVWLRNNIVMIGHTYRSNAQGLTQVEHLMDGSATVLRVQLPHYRGPQDVFHLMSVLSPLDRDLLLIYSPLMPIAVRQWLLDQGYGFVEVPDEEFESMACNVLALGPRFCLALEGNPITRRRMEKAGCDVRLYKGREISIKGMGGPTCLSRPLIRES